MVRKLPVLIVCWVNFMCRVRAITMEIMVKRDAATGQPYTSEISFPFSSFMTTIPNELMIEAGYCYNELECDWKREHDSYYCGGHYSWEVIFQKSY